MPTYRQRHTVYEDGHGELSLTVVVSDTFGGLFETVGTINVGVLDIGKSSKDLEVKGGVLAEDEVQLKINEAAIETQDDADAAAFVVDAQDPTVSRYLAIFIDTPDLPAAPLVDDCEFLGRLRPDLKGTDLRHHGAQWGVDINAEREWDLQAATFMDVTIEDISLKDLVYGNAPELVTGIDTTWESANVADRLGYFKSPVGDYYYNREARYGDLVSLAALLRKLADNVEQTLLDRGIGNYTIVFDDVDLDVTFSPARFIVEDAFIPPWKTRVLKRTVSGASTFKVLAGDAVTCSLGDSYVLTDDAPHVSYRLIKHAVEREKAHTWTERYKTFTELLYAVAASLGIYVRFYQTSPTQIHIRFLPRTEISGASQIWIRDATDGSVDLSVEEATSDSDEHVGLMSTYTADGVDEYWQDGPTPRGESKAFLEDSSRGVKPALTTGVSLVKMGPAFMEWGLVTYGDGSFKGRVPHNVRYYRDAFADSIFGGTVGLTTGIYVSADQNGEYINGTLQKIFAPVARVHAVIDGEAQDFETLADYVNAVSVRDSDFFQTEYSLTVPYINGFSAASDGSGASWKTLQLGSRVVIEERSVPQAFTVVGIERDYSTVETTLKLHRLSRFAFTPSSGLGSDVDIDLEGADVASGLASKGSITVIAKAGEDIASGDAVVIDSVEAESLVVVRRATATAAHAGEVIGVTLHEALTDEFVEIQVSGRATSLTWTLVPGKDVFVRTQAYPAPNISQTALLIPAGSEDAYIVIGKADSPNSIALDLSTQCVLDPEAAWDCG